MSFLTLGTTAKTILYGDIGLTVFAFLHDWMDAFNLMLVCRASLNASWTREFVRWNRYHLCRFKDFERIYELVEKIKYCECCYENSNNGDLTRLLSLRNVSLENCSVEGIISSQVGPQLWYLDAKQSFSGFSGLSNCCNLVSLHLVSVRLESWNFLSSTKHLEYLYVDNSDEYLVADYLPSDWQPFESVAISLRDLHISSPRDSDHKLEPLSSLTKLQSLFLCFYSIQDYIFFRSLESLETLHVFVDGHETATESPIPASYYTHLGNLSFATFNNLDLLGREEITQLSS